MWTNSALYRHFQECLLQVTDISDMSCELTSRFNRKKSIFYHGWVALILSNLFLLLDFLLIKNERLFLKMITEGRVWTVETGSGSL